jgi:hypothetical protein
VGAKGDGLDGGDGLDRPADESSSGVTAPGAQSAWGSSPPSWSMLVHIREERYRAQGRMMLAHL